ncbi:hypothetical protein ACFLX9_03955, partial [Chloroflexota bacterium]
LSDPCLDQSEVAATIAHIAPPASILRSIETAMTVQMSPGRIGPSRCLYYSMRMPRCPVAPLQQEPRELSHPAEWPYLPW